MWIAEKRLEEYSKEVQDYTRPRRLHYEKASTAIHPSPCSKAFFQKSVCRDIATTTIERNEITRSEIRRNGYGEREDKRVPVRGESLSRVAKITDAADVSGKNRHAHHPSRQASAGRSELVGRRIALEERTSEEYHTERKHKENHQIDNMHTLIFACKYTKKTRIFG